MSAEEREAILIRVTEITAALHILSRPASPPCDESIKLLHELIALGKKLIAGES